MEASSLLSKLESSPDLENIHTLISNYLLPFTSTLTKKPPNSTKTLTDNTRALAKQFLPFLNRALSLIPKRLLSQSPKLNLKFADKLFDSYILCLNCLDSLSSQLSGKPYSVHLQRVRLVHCYLFWERYRDADSEGVSLLRSLWKLGGDGSRNEYVPDLKGEYGEDHEFAWLVVEIVVSLVKCVAMSRSKVESEFQRLLVMINEVMPWFRVLDANAYEKLHRVHVSYMSKCASLLVDDLNNFDDKLAHTFCLATFGELEKSSPKDQFLKFALRICYSLFSQQNNQSSVVAILACVLDSAASACKAGTHTTSMELLELVSYCANKSLHASSNINSTVAEKLQNIADGICLASSSPIDLLPSLYATGLFISNFCGQTMAKGSTSTRTDKNSSIYGFLLYNEHRLQNLTVFFQSLKSHYSSTKRISLHQMHSLTEHENTDLISYFSALKFLCKPLAEFVNFERETILSDIEDATSAARLNFIQDALHQYLDIFILCQRVSEKKRGAHDDNNKTTLSAAVATIVLSIRTKQRIKESATFIKNAISSDWIQSHGLKFLFASLYNVGVVLYKNNEMKEALLSLKLCYRASWTRLLTHCKMFVDKSIEFCGDLSEDSIVDLLAEACTRSAFVLDVLYRSDYNKVNKLITYSLEKWAAAQNIFDRLANPTTLLKQWVKIQCKISKVGDGENNAKTLYSLLSCSVQMSKRALGILLEQELLLYEELNPLNPTFCHRMRLDITDILLKEVYVTNTIQRSRVLIAKGREIRACGVERLDDCIECLSESISVMSKTNCNADCDSICSFYLANAYCLRALCTQEAEPDRKVLLLKRSLEDIDAAIKLWMNIDFPRLSGQIDMVFEKLLFLLYHVYDLLSLKGYIKFHSNIYEIMIRLFKWRSVPIKKLLAILWECRRLGHALCASPVNETFITTLLNYCDAANTMEFWLSCLKESQSLEVGFKQNFFYMFADFSLGSHHHGSSQSEITIGGIKQAVSNLLSSVPLPSGSASVAAFMYYDLGERLISNGQFIEALSYAKEAYQIRSKLFRETFMYNIDQQNGQTMQEHYYSLKNLVIFSSAATAAWFSECVSRDFESHVVTPWNVLQCYLESILQVGYIHEIVGNGSDAKTLLLWGKEISIFQDLPIFIISFSSVLGKLYCKEQMWDLAELELQKAQHLLEKLDSRSPFYCCKCKLVLEVTIDQQLGDLSRSRCDSNIDDLSVNRLLYAEKRYRVALKKLKNSEWKNSVSNPEEATISGTSSSSSSQSDYSETKIAFECCSMEETKGVQGITSKSRKVAKILPQGKCLTRQQNRMMTRSRRKNIECDQEVASENKIIFPSSDAVDNNTKIANFGNNDSIICKEIKCWYCLPHDVRESRCLINYIHMKWELVRRRLLVRVLTSIGKCLVIQDERQKGHEIFSECISVLVARNQFSPTYNAAPFSLKLDLIGSDIPGDVLAVERATVLYNLCWFILKYYRSKGTSAGSDFSGITIARVMSWLKLAFLICREVPVLFRKVSRLLAVLYICSSVEILSLSSSHSDAVTASQWGSYFHQASLGTHFNQQLYSEKARKQKGESFSGIKGCLSTLSLLGQETENSLRHAPDLLLREFVSNFYQSLPPAAIICVSLLGVAYASLLRELFSSHASVQAWILLSRLNSDSQPVFLLLPADSILGEALGDDETSSQGFLHENTDSVKRWRCPWGSTVVDDVAPVFKLILEQNYLSSSTFPLEDTKMIRSLWWTQRKKLDQRLRYFLRDIEEKWFGPWKFLLCSDWSDCKHLKLATNKLAEDLKVKCNVDLHESLLRVILAGGQHACESTRCVPELILNKGCHVDGVECNIDEMSMALKLILETIHGLEDICVTREPIILVLDHEIQMLPWESLPILRNQEVYRMPSVCSIFASLDRHDHEKLGTGSIIFPSIDPLDAYYLLNPSGDLPSTEVQFDKWFKDQNLEGKTGITPTIEELTVALQSHELFIYFGHGSGAQYIPNHEVQKLRTCAATLLMGCSSGSLSLSGSYSPKGAPLCYLLAGSPVIVANLWEVTDKDIDRFGKAMLDAWLRERSTEVASCAQCDAITDELKSLSIHEAKGKEKKKSSRNFLPETCDVGKCNPSCRHRPKLGTFMSQAREACTLPFLIGASPVCYGVPTGIKKKVIL
ncbi:separase isoform X1 [Apium graveolens]|uniref:separase isoform X1 n=2 Tax=Apium graveolens TaxID=4045 RepID=UPI003D7AA493